MSMSTNAASDLSARLAAIATTHDRDIYDKEFRLTPFPLWALLVIYEKAERDCYIDYMQGFKLLVSWLTPIAYPIQEGIKYTTELLGSYETQRMAKILNTYETVIIKCVVEEVLPRMSLTEITGDIK